jgi:site-specific DNA-methyltransferase (adenine-specific)
MINLHHTDCMEFMRGLPDKAYDLAIVDPDFGLGDRISNGGTWAAKYKREDGNLGGKPPKEYWQELRRVSVDQIVWGGNYFADELPATRCWIVWDKVAHMETLADCELAWTSMDRNAKIYAESRVHHNRIHICQKPVALYRWLLQNYAKPGQKILDTHGGSMSIAIACDIEGFDLDLCELDKDYFEAGKKRLEAHQAQPRMFDAPKAQPAQQLTLE